jgi:ketosteroid isomerase-like protein
MKTLRLAAILLLLPWLAIAQPQSATPDAAELTKLLHEFLAGASRNDAAMHDRFWAEDLIYTGSSGTRRGKAEIMESVRKEGPAQGEPGTVYSAEDIRVQQYGDTAIVAFRLVGTTKKADKAEVANYLNTGTFLKRDGKWQVVSWQATKLADEKSADQQNEQEKK